MRLSDDIINEFILLFEDVRDRQFDIGDRLIELVEMHGDKASVINNLAGNLNVSAGVLYDYMRVAEKWSPAMREIYQHLDFTFYRNTDPNDPEDMELLDRAIDENWNVTRYKEEKYPAMRDPWMILGKVRGMLTKVGWPGVDTVIKMIDELLELNKA